MDDAEFPAFARAAEDLIKSMRYAGELEMLILNALKAAQAPLANHFVILTQLRVGYVDLITRPSAP